MGLSINEKDNSFVLNFLDFGGGLNTRDLDTIIRDNELSDVSNFNFDKRGALKVRPGFTKFGNTALGSFDVKSVGGYYKVGAAVEIIATGSTIISKVISTSKTDMKTLDCFAKQYKSKNITVGLEGKKKGKYIWELIKELEND